MLISYFAALKSIMDPEGDNTKPSYLIPPSCETCLYLPKRHSPSLVWLVWSQYGCDTSNHERILGI